jgi:hypothetical protein
MVYEKPSTIDNPYLSALIFFTPRIFVWLLKFAEAEFALL